MVTMIVLLFVAWHGNAQSETFTARCEDLKYTCGTSFFDESIEVSCAYPPSGWKGEPVYADVVITYKCDFERQGGVKVVVCKGFMGLSPETRATFGEMEFRNAQVRCTDLCKPCPKGWK
jgi:hypothetical protein